MRSMPDLNAFDRFHLMSSETWTLIFPLSRIISNSWSNKFSEFPKLGVAGTPMREAKYHALKDSFYNENDVFGACQLFRRECFERSADTHQ